MNESKDESKVTIKSSFLIGLIVFALILLITVVFLFGFLIGSGKNKQTIVTKIDEFTIGNSSGNKENITNTNAITQREDNFKQNKKNENLSTQKEEDKDTAYLMDIKKKSQVNHHLIVHQVKMTKVKKIQEI